MPKCPELNRTGEEGHKLCSTGKEGSGGGGRLSLSGCVSGSQRPLDTGMAGSARGGLACREKEGRGSSWEWSFF